MLVGRLEVTFEPLGPDGEFEGLGYCEWFLLLNLLFGERIFDTDHTHGVFHRFQVIDTNPIMIPLAFTGMILYILID